MRQSVLMGQPLFRATRGGQPSFRTRQPEGPRLAKKLAALEAGLPEKGKDEIVKHRMSTLIKQRIQAIKEGHLLGGRDMKEALRSARAVRAPGMAAQGESRRKNGAEAVTAWEPCICLR